MPRFLLPLERVGALLWRHVQPLSRRLLPVRTPAQALALGMVWGWLPCGLVYSALTTALASGSAGAGAATMLAFGLGTLPNLLLAGILATQLRALMQAPWLRRTAGLAVFAIGLYGLLGVWRLLQAVG
jgi:sulfite exporter TauE/SafE